MPLGRQFSNTFHTDERGNMIFHTDPQSLSQPTPDATGVTDITNTPNPHKPLVEKGPEGIATGHRGVSYQGMFFSPEHFTGLKSDPTIPEEDRKATIEKALKLQPDNYAQNIKGQFPSRDTAKVEQSRQAILNAAHETAIPTHTFKNDVNVNVIASNKLGSSTGGDFLHSQNRIRTRVKSDKIKVSEETVMHQSRAITGEKLTNPNWEKDTQPIAHRIKDGVFTHGYGSKYPAEQLFAGKGEHTDDYFAENMKLHTGYGPSGRRTFKMFHTRLAVAPVGEPKQVTRPVYQETMTSSQDTIAHEIGHSLDTNTKPTFKNLRNLKGADTVLEGIADGVADRFVRHGHDYERALAPSPQRADELKYTGYSTKDKNVAGTATNQALYAAIRTHVAMGDHNYKDIQNRSDLYKKHPLRPIQMNNASVSWEISPDHSDQLRHANTLLLGHLYSSHQHVRDSLEHLGIAHVGEKAAHYYRSQVTDAGQDSLPGFENHGE
jgi:hypothetical protein